MGSSTSELSVPLYGTDAYVTGIRTIAERNIGLQDQVADNANVAFRDATPQEVVTKPVAMHEEADYIYQSLEAFSERGRVERSIILSCNAPLGADRAAVDQTKSEIVRFTETHPQVPLSLFETSYGSNTTIGEIRADAMGVSIGALCNRYGFKVPRTVLLVNADADTMSAPSGYADRLYDAAMEAEYPEMSFIYPAIRTANSGGRFPNMDAVMEWTDLFAVYGEKYSDGHNAMGIGTYLAGEQYDRNCDYAETTELLMRARERAGHVMHERFIGPDAVIVSGRHAYHQMQEGDEPHFVPVRSELTNYRSEIASGEDIAFATAYRHIDRLCLAELYSVVAIQTEHAVREGLEGVAAKRVAIARTRKIMMTEMDKMHAPYRQVGAVEGQLDRMDARARAMQKVA